MPGHNTHWVLDLQLQHTLARGVDDHIAALYSDVLDEITISFSEYIPDAEGEYLRGLYVTCGAEG